MQVYWPISGEGGDFAKCHFVRHHYWKGVFLNLGCTFCGPFLGRCVLQRFPPYALPIQPLPTPPTTPPHFTSSYPHLLLTPPPPNTTYGPELFATLRARGPTYPLDRRQISDISHTIYKLPFTSQFSNVSRHFQVPIIDNDIQYKHAQLRP